MAADSKKAVAQTPLQGKVRYYVDETQSVLARECNPEWSAFYRMLWHLGGSQSDMAMLQADDVDWERRVIVYGRRKTGTICHLSFGQPVESLLKTLPSIGPLFPRIAQLHERHRSKQFRRRCLQLGFEGISLHS